MIMTKKLQNQHILWHPSLQITTQQNHGTAQDERQCSRSAEVTGRGVAAGRVWESKRWKWKCAWASANQSTLVSEFQGMDITVDRYTHGHDTTKAENCLKGTQSSPSGNDTKILEHSPSTKHINKKTVQVMAIMWVITRAEVKGKCHLPHAWEWMVGSKSTHGSSDSNHLASTTAQGKI